MRRLYVRVCHDSGCWEWRGGSGRLTNRSNRHWLNNQSVPPKSFFYRLFNGDYDDSLVLDQTCGNRACVNPAHIEAVTRSEKGIRAWARTRGKRFCFREFVEGKKEKRQ